MTGLLKIRSIDPSLGALRLDDLDLIDRLGRAFEKNERRVLSWAYFAKVLATTIAKARTRVAILEAAGLIEHQSLRSGNVYFMTDKGQRVLWALRGEPTSAPRKQPYELPKQTAPLAQAETCEKVVVSGEAKAVRRFVRVPSQEVMSWAGHDLGHRILGLPDQIRDLVVHALAEGRDLTLPEVARAGLSLFAAVELLAAITAKRVLEGGAETSSLHAPIGDPKGVGAPTPKSPRRAPSVTKTAVRDSLSAKRTPVDKVKNGSRGPADPETTSVTLDGRTPTTVTLDPSKGPEVNAVMALVRLAVTEAQSRHPDLVQAATFAERLLPELVWASMKGVLADYGEPLRRVRTALRLMSEHRWTTPRHMPPSFVSQFPITDVAFAVC
ncbi:MAG: hypothetical protein O9256_00915 [Rhizobiaceae bacterium]|nr:hypothetical protein [Rhizobiaceae bacterium]